LSCQRHIPYLWWNLSFLERVLLYKNLVHLHVGSCIVYDLFVKPLFVFFQCVLMLSLEPHLHLFVRFGNQTG
jgi:hypothetical protein